MNDHAKYAKIVTWSNEDNCYVGSCPEIMFGGCHGDDEVLVFQELCHIVDEIVALYRQDGKPLPIPIAAQKIMDRLLDVA
jgi:predicted RNase H-like HicB family nuclease